MAKGRQPGQTPKYTAGIGYVVAFRRGRTPEQIAKFFKVKSVNTVKALLKNHGIDLEKVSENKARKLQAKVLQLEMQIAKLKGVKRDVVQPAS